MAGNDKLTKKCWEGCNNSLALGLVGDGLAGYSGEKLAENVLAPAGGSANKVVAAQQLGDDLEAGKITYQEYTQKWNAMKPKDVLVKVNADQFRLHYVNGNILESQSNDAENVQEWQRKGDCRSKRFIQQRASTSGSQQPPQQPTENNRPENLDIRENEEKLIRDLRQRLKKLFEEIRERASVKIRPVNGAQKRGDFKGKLSTEFTGSSFICFSTVTLSIFVTIETSSSPLMTSGGVMKS